ncbi:MAG TPA: hypothetical protein DCO75_01815 [Fibrobacteres bacterium]|nr:hypothetical protein [Fibrobacterota bacterium]
MNNPEPIADFIDAFAIGDGEETIVSLCKCMEECKESGVARRQILEMMSGIPGVYVPALYPVKKNGLFATPDTGRGIVRSAKIPDLPDSIYPDKPLVPLINVVHHRLAVEVMRGCTRSCRFCAAGYYYRPVRERDPLAISDQISRTFLTTGWREIGLLSLSTADYSNLSHLLPAITSLMRKHRIDVSIPSTRLDALTEDQLRMLDAVTSTSSFTIAPEAGSARLRRVINKNFSDDAIMRAVDLLMKGNVQTLKLYFMIGLPTENDEDIEALINLASKIADKVRQRSKRRAVHVSISPFSPKAQTPFQWEAMGSPESLDKKSRYIKQELCRNRNVKVSYHDPKVIFLETVMARGDRYVSALIYEAWRCGARNDGWVEHFKPEVWKKAATDISVDMNIYTSAIPVEQPLPWSAISNGIPDSFLKEELKRAILEIPGKDCRDGECNGCGLCNEKIFTKKYEFVPVSPDNAKNAAEPELINEDRKFYYRINYCKTGFMRFSGHRDMMNVIQRAISATLLPIAYSNGFHPVQKLSFGPPLPLGVVGESEFFDIVTNNPVETDEVLSINKFLPHGLEIKTVVEINGSGESLNAIITHGEYVFYPLFSAGFDELDHVVKNALCRQEISVAVATDVNFPAEPEFKNIRPLIVDLALVSNSGRTGIEAVLSLLPKATCKPMELVAGLFPERSIRDFLIIRKRCLKGEAGSLTAV